MLSIFQSHGTMHTQSKPTFVLLGHPIFCLITCLLAPVWHLLLASLLACFPSICFFAHPIQTYICPPRAPHFLFHYMFTCPHLTSFASLSFSMLSFYLLLCLSADLFLLPLHVHAWSMDTWSKGVAFQAQAKRAGMQAHKGQCSVDQGAQPFLSGFFFLSLSKPLLQSMYQGSPFTCTLSLSCSLLGPRSLDMIMFVLHFLYLVGSYPWNVGNVCFTFRLCMIALCMIYVCIYIYVYMLSCVWVIVHFV